MLVQFHIQERANPQQSEFLAQSEFDDETLLNPAGQHFVEWSNQLSNENIDLVEDSGGKLVFMVCNQDSPDFFVECGVGDSGIKQITKRRNLAPAQGS